MRLTAGHRAMRCHSWIGTYTLAPPENDVGGPTRETPRSQREVPGTGEVVKSLAAPFPGWQERNVFFLIAKLVLKCQSPEQSMPEPRGRAGGGGPRTRPLPLGSRGGHRLFLRTTPSSAYHPHLTPPEGDDLPVYGCQVQRDG